VKQVGRELGVRYVLEGSVRKAAWPRRAYLGWAGRLKPTRCARPTSKAATNCIANQGYQEDNKEETGMADTFDTCLAFTLREEGGYVDDPADPGGATNMGITLVTYRQWSENPNLGPTQVQGMTERTARAIYRSLYWNPLRADALPSGVDLSVFDMGVNAGIWGSARLLQRAVGFTGEEVDGCIGPETLAAAGKWDPRTLVNDLAKQQLAYYRTLSDFPTFGTGWLNRTEARHQAALAMIAASETSSA